MKVSEAHIAGVGITDVPNGSHAELGKYAIFGATKALLDAGITYGDVDVTVACSLDDLRIPTSTFDAFGKRGAPIFQVDNAYGLLAASQSVGSKQSECTLLVAIDMREKQSQGWLVGIVLVSDLFLTSHAYLKDGSVTVRGIAVTNSIHSASLGGPDLPRTVRTSLQTALRQANIEMRDVQVVDIRHNQKWSAREALSEFDVAPQIGYDEALTGIAGYTGLCSLVWQLRGWADARQNSRPSKARNCLQLVLGADTSATAIVLRRSDGKSALMWDKIQNVRDGRERLGYNPAVEMRDVSREDLATVMTTSHFAPIASSGEQLGLSVKGGDRAALARL